MKRKCLILIFLLIAGLLCGCAGETEAAQIAATTLPVYDFTVHLTQGTGLTVTRLVTESVSCLHDYSLNVSQVRAAEAAEVIVISGMGLEDFMADILSGRGAVIDSSADVPCLEGHEHEHGHEHSHEEDPHIWLSPANAKIMAQNICEGLCGQYPEHASAIQHNLTGLLEALDTLDAYGQAQLAALSCRELITFHDGFGYLAEHYGLTVLEAVEEESGSEASAAELVSLIGLTQSHQLPAIFTETNGSTAAARIISAETGAGLFALDMAMAGDSYFDAMYHNIDTLKEALQ